jgi:hypothetical protein
LLVPSLWPDCAACRPVSRLFARALAMDAGGDEPKDADPVEIVVAPGQEEQQPEQVRAWDGVCSR